MQNVDGQAETRPVRTAPPPAGVLRLLTAAVAALALMAGAMAPAESIESSAAETWVTPASSVLPQGAQVVGEFPVADAVVVWSNTPPEGAVPIDAPLEWNTDDAAVLEVENGYVDPAIQSLGAQDVWAAGERGADALVAVIDTGVADVAGLEGSVAGEIDFSGTGGGDGYGHGTYMASLIAASTDGAAPGVAPDAGVVSLKVADDEGITDLGKVLGALEWLHGPGRSLGLRVATLALGIDPDEPAAAIIDAATTHLSAAGTVVVTSSGNDEEAQQLASPATSPGTLSAGSLDADGNVSDFSGAGNNRVGVAQPDVFVPGEDIIGHVHPDSMLAREAALDAVDGQAERIAQGYLRASGTSASAALTAGIAALASSANDELDGLELAQALGMGSEGTRLDAPTAVRQASAMQTSRPERELLRNGRGRPVHPHTDPFDLPMPPVAQWDATQWNGSGWASAQWAIARWNSNDWGMARPTLNRWNIAKWNIAKWNAQDWGAATWDASHWDAAEWDRRQWQIAKWNIAKWNIAKWNIAKWNAHDWDIAKWNGGDWDIAKWNGHDWDIAKWNIAKWNIAKWNIAKWNIAKWNLTLSEGG